MGFWANKGGGRKLYIVDKATGKALDPATDYHAEGWVQNVKDAAGNMIYEADAYHRLLFRRSVPHRNLRRQ